MYGMRTTAVRAAAPIAAILLLAGCADGGEDPFAVTAGGASAKTTTTTTTSPVGKGPTDKAPTATTAPSSRTPEQAQALATTLALTPEDWGTGVVKQSTYEYAGETWTDYAADCTQQSVPLPATLVGQWVRQVQLPPDAANPGRLSSGSTSVIVHKDVGGAHEQVQNARQVKDRCATRIYTDGTQAKDTPGAAQPSLPEADEVFAEEGQMFDKSGAGPWPYVVLTVRKDTVVFSAYFTSTTADRLPEVRTRTTQAARLMLDRLLRS
ncbi:hypothetical protein [Embleya sp. NBC_00896]|uniref:hypothetical protein n=1 Tax=Embleya sp. NBC_00896 TaxID=2975961 RepID=UPI003864FA34|nr:hypothetical protein OG928_20250 [Embleya sp. NBC_00896]